MTLTKDQRYTRKKLKESRQDFKKAKTVDGKPSVHATQKKLSAKIGSEAYEKLKARAAHEGITQSALIERMLINGLPSYVSHASEVNTTNRYFWNEPNEPLTRSRKGSTGKHQINLWIGSTAWKKLEVHADTIGQSKARILDRLIRCYKFLSEAGKQRNRDHAERMKEIAAKYKTKYLRVCT